MKHLLRYGICVSAIMLFFLTAGYAQIKGDPEMKGKVKPLADVKSSEKLSPSLKNLHEKIILNTQQNNTDRKGGSSADLEKFMQIKGDKVLVDFTAKGDVGVAKKQLQKLGVKITNTYGRVISGYVPIKMLPQLETENSIRFVKPSYKPMHQSINARQYLLRQYNLAPPVLPVPVISQGDTAQLSNIARNKYRVNGRGVKVGILSDSYNNLGTASTGVNNGELPGKANPFGYKRNVEVIKDLDSNGTDEGRAMAEIIHDVAPGSPLAFYTAFDGSADFAQGIQTLADHGCKVINDDIIYFDEPFFQDGIIAQSVDIVKKRGVTYFSSAGNQSIRSYESIYRPTNVELFGPGNGTVHNFSGTPGFARLGQPIYIPTGGELLFSFQWDQSSFAASGVGPTTDMDIYLTDIFGNVVAQGATNNILSGEPVEIMYYPNSSNDNTFFVYIVKYSGPDPEHLKYIMFGNELFYLTTPAIPGILSPTLIGHAKAEGAIATGAAFYLNTPPYGLDTALVERYSSQGGVANYLDIKGKRITPIVRKKPNIVAPDGGNTSFFGFDIPEDADNYPNFFGTSAAAPHAAGVAALMIQAERLNNITPDQIKGVLSATASDMDDRRTPGFDKGFDFATGYGFINADKAVGRVKFPNRFIADLKIVPICSDDPSTIRNWKVENSNPFPVDVVWYIQGSGQHGSLTVQPGSGTFTSNTIKGFECANIAVISWKDNFGFPRFDLDFSTRAKCGVDDVSPDNSDRTMAATTGAATVDNTVNSNVAEVYPNPSANVFRLYLLLANDQKTSIELFSADGKKLQTKTINQSKGVIDIDASGYNPGIYLLNVKQGNFTKTIKLVKQ